MAAPAMVMRVAQRMSRRWLAATAVVVPLLATVVLHPRPDPLLALSPVLSLVCLAFLLGRSSFDVRRVPPAVVSVSLFSLTATVFWVFDDQRARAGPWPLLQTVVLMVLIALVCRQGVVRVAIPAGALGVLAVAVLGIPVTGEVTGGWWNLLLVTGFWSLAGLFAAASGCYLRWLDARRVRAVAHARRTQRLQLATDLHDFVAHDVSAMVIRAQAAQVLLGTDPQAAGRLLREIETDGTQALASMDRTIHVMRDLEAGRETPPRTPLPGVDDLPELIHRYGQAELDLPGDLILPRETSATVYRIVVEALTNVRRHAAPGAAVRVSLAPEGEALVLCVTNDSESRSNIGGFNQRSSGGTGLRNLAQRVETLGGAFAAGPLPSGGWQVRAEFATKDGGGRR